MRIVLEDNSREEILSEIGFEIVERKRLVVRNRNSDKK